MRWIVGLLLLVAGCTPVETPTSTSPSPSNTEPTVNDLTDETIPATPPSPSPRSGAVEVAIAALRAYEADPPSQKAWFARLSPYLTQAAAEEYVYTDPANIAKFTIGRGKLVETDQPSDLSAIVDVDTSEGTYEILLVQEDDEPGWLVAEINPPVEDPQ